MTPDVTSQVTAGLLILTLASVLLIALVLTLFAISYVKRSRNLVKKIASRGPTRVTTCYPTALVETPSRWLVVRGSSVPAVAKALQLHNASPCSWGEGMVNAEEHGLFIAPPVKGWILVVGQAVPDPADDVDECFRFISKLSAVFGQVQFFSANRALNHHAWAKANDGRIVRAYAWAGETLWNQGKATSVEAELEMRCYDYGETIESAAISITGSPASNTEKIGVLAARWSFDPMAVDPTTLPAEEGLAGHLIPSRLY